MANDPYQTDAAKSNSSAHSKSNSKSSNLWKFWLMAVLIPLLLLLYPVAKVVASHERSSIATTKWNADRQRLWMGYAGLSSSAAANDDLAYGLLMPIVFDSMTALDADATAIGGSDATSHHDFIEQARRCVPTGLSTFNAKTPDTEAACRLLLQPGT